MTMKANPSIPGRIGLAFLIAAAAALIGSGSIAHADAPAPPAPPPMTASATAPFSVRALVSQAEAALAAGHPGRAILDYERARLMAPRAPAVAAGLARARAAANLPPLQPIRPERAARWLGADAWAWIAMGGIITIALASQRWLGVSFGHAASLWRLPLRPRSAALLWERRTICRRRPTALWWWRRTPSPASLLSRKPNRPLSPPRAAPSPSNASITGIP